MAYQWLYNKLINRLFCVTTNQRIIKNVKVMNYSRLDKYEKPSEISQNDQKLVTMYKNVLDKKIKTK